MENANGPVDANELILIHNVVTMRHELVKLLSSKTSQVENIYKDCNWPDSALITPDALKESFDRNPFGAKVVELFPKECWQVLPIVYETDDLETETPFEQGLRKVCQTLQGESWFDDISQMTLWSHLKDLDIKSGIGTFGVMILGLSDGKSLDEPVTGIDIHGMMKARKNKTVMSSSSPKEVGMGEDAEDVDEPFVDNLDFVMGGFTEIPTAAGYGLKKTEEVELQYVRTFDETQIEVVQWETDRKSRRYGQPVMYSIDSYDPSVSVSQSAETQNVTAVKVHWTRVIHVAEGGATFGTPRQRPVWNVLLDLQKLMGASAEMYWRGAFPGLSIETIPQLGGDVKIDAAALREQMASYQSRLQRYLALMGMTAKSLAPQVVDPTKQILVQVQALCVKLACPARKFLGSEIGELASSQDDSVWNDRLRERQRMFITPHIIVPLINRLIMCGVLPEPQKYQVWWPDLETADAVKMADVGLKKTQSIVQFMQGDGESIFPLRYFYTKILGLTEPEAQAILEEAQEQLENPDLRISQSAEEKQKIDAEAKQEAAKQLFDQKQVEGKMRMAGAGNDPTKMSKEPAFIKRSDKAQ